MLWYKSWLETRWRFLIGLGLLTLSAAATVLAYPQLMKLLPLVPASEFGGELGRRLNEAVALSRDYRGYVWSQWFRQNMPQIWGIFAVLLGTGGLLAQTSNGGALFTLSLPVTRNRLLGVRAGIALAELFVLAFVPSLVISILSPAIGRSYGVADVVVHGACIFIAGGVFFSLAFLLSTVFSDIWRPMLIVFCGFALLAFVDQFVLRSDGGFAQYSLLHVMSGEGYFRSGHLPWIGLLVSAGISTGMLFAATKRIARQDF